MFLLCIFMYLHLFQLSSSTDNCINNVPLDNPDYISNIRISHDSICDYPISDLNIYANGCHFNVLPSIEPVKFSIEFTSPVTLTTISTGSQTNINTFTIHLFDNDGTDVEYTSTMVNDIPVITDIPNILVTSFNISILSTIDEQSPNTVTFGLTACFPLTINSNESAISSNNCPQVSLTNHPDVELIIFDDGTNVTSDLDPAGNGCNLISTGTTMTVLLQSGMSAVFSSISILSPNVNQIDVALFDEISNQPIIQSPQGSIRSSITLNPSIKNLPSNAAATLVITFLNTIDGQPPRNVKLLVNACFPTTNYNSSSIELPNVCIDSYHPSQVISIANMSLPPEYYSSNQCVCICQADIILPTSSNIIQYNPLSHTINKR
ncbi:unnamed protein product [Adineta steineri]|uniref:Uncharacterized protein n=1 Tax=Adineta steineri TaxID=433720 RepID=A0A816FDD7_9BILA|nr:unnamed protein product [Adineta steineri]CAF1660096.1 unnamed protein product [Adineta steineri]